MGKGYDTHHSRVQALQSLGKELARRAKSKCELTGAAGVPLKAYEIPPVAADPDIEKTLLVSEACIHALENPKQLKGRQWQILTEMVWSESAAVQVVAWRMLERLSRSEDWASDALQEVFLDEDVEAWAKSALL